MSAAEIVMKRDDPNIAWGFRLTGGADLGTPFYVVKVLGRGHAERAGLRVGDMVYAINHKYIDKFTHKDAQNAILHTGDTLIINIKRGPASGRGTPLPEYTDPLMGIAAPSPNPRPKPVPLPPYEPPPREPTPPLSDEEPEGEDIEAAFKIKINPKGRIAAIEELPVTPPSSRSSSRARSRSRSRSRTRDVRAKRDSSTSHSQQQQGTTNGFVPLTSGPGEAFTYSKEVLTQYSTVLSASEQTQGQVSEMINEAFVIHGGSQHKMEDILSPEDIERDIFEEKMEEQKIQELLTGEAEVLDKGIVGINFQKIIPKTGFIKESNVFKELQEQVTKKEEPEEEQLRKDPTKRFSTFLQTPKRPVPKPKSKLQPQEDLPWKQRLPSPILGTLQSTPLVQNVQHMQTSHQEQTIQTSTSTKTTSEVVNITEAVTFQEIRDTKEELLVDERLLMVTRGPSPIITEAVSSENISDEKVRFREESQEKADNRCAIEEYSEEKDQKSKTVTPEQTEKEVQEVQNKTEYKSEFERQLADIQKQIEAIQQLPSVLQANLTALQEQLTKIVEGKASAEQGRKGSADEESKEKAEEHPSQKRDSIRSNLSWKIDVVSVEEKKIENNEEDVKEETLEPQYDQEIVMQVNVENVNGTTTENEESESSKPLVNGFDVEYENIKNLRHYQKDDDNLSVSKPPYIRNFPQKIAERPIVLPGGRKWYKPRDAYNEDFIAETIINQSEVLVGSTIGLNFRKYEPPKFDAANSAVYRLVREIEEKGSMEELLPIEARPAKILAEVDYGQPISKRHFFAARLAEQSNDHIEKILQEAKEQGIVFV